MYAKLYRFYQIKGFKNNKVHLKPIVALSKRRERRDKKTVCLAIVVKKISMTLDRKIPTARAVPKVDRFKISAETSLSLILTTSIKINRSRALERMSQNVVTHRLFRLLDVD